VNIVYLDIRNLSIGDKMMFPIPSPTYKNRLLIIASGIVILVWSGLEDNQVWGVVFLGWVIAVISIMTVIISRYGRQTYPVKSLMLFSPIIGMSIGASASVITALLMIFKTIRHSHIFPDYPPQMILAILERLPIWALGSGFITLGIFLLLISIHPISPNNLNNT